MIEQAELNRAFLSRYGKPSQAFWKAELWLGPNTIIHVWVTSLIFCQKFLIHMSNHLSLFWQTDLNPFLNFALKGLFIVCKEPSKELYTCKKIFKVLSKTKKHYSQSRLSYRDKQGKRNFSPWVRMRILGYKNSSQSLSPEFSIRVCLQNSSPKFVPRVRP